jgi:hypothetical protein
LQKHRLSDENINHTAARVHVFELESKIDLQHYCSDKSGFNKSSFERAIEKLKKKKAWSYRSPTSYQPRTRSSLHKNPEGNARTG